MGRGGGIFCFFAFFIDIPSRFPGQPRPSQSIPISRCHRSLQIVRNNNSRLSQDHADTKHVDRNNSPLEGSAAHFPFLLILLLLLRGLRGMMRQHLHLLPSSSAIHKCYFVIQPASPVASTSKKEQTKHASTQQSLLLRDGPPFQLIMPCKSGTGASRADGTPRRHLIHAPRRRVG